RVRPDVERLRHRHQRAPGRRLPHGAGPRALLAQDAALGTLPRRVRSARGGGWLMSLTLLFQDTGTLPTKIAQEGMGFQFPPPASTDAEKFDSLYTFITNVGIFFTVLIFGVLFWLVWRFRQSKHPKAERTATHNTPLELVWSILPGFVLAYMFWVGFKDFLDFRTPPSDSIEIQVTGQKWNWSSRYPGGNDWPELHVPVGQPVTLRITSTDVLHS